MQSNGITLRQILERARNRADNGAFVLERPECHARIKLRFWGHGHVQFTYSHTNNFHGNIPEELLDVSHLISSDSGNPTAQFVAMRRVVSSHTANALVTLWEPWVLEALDFNVRSEAA